MQTNDGWLGMKVWRRWGIPLVLGGAAFLIMLLGDGAAMGLRYQREAVLEGEIWRLLSGHLVHLGWSHVLMNLMALGLIWALFGDVLSIAAWLLLLLSSALFDGLGLLLMSPEIKWYVGLSGVLHGLFTAGALAALVSGRRDGLLLLGVLAAKLLWEQFAGPLPGSEAGAGGPVVVDAHLYGAIAGAVTLSLLLGVPGWRRRFLRT